MLPSLVSQKLLLSTNSPFFIDYSVYQEAASFLPPKIGFQEQKKTCFHPVVDPGILDRGFKFTEGGFDLLILPDYSLEPQCHNSMNMPCTLLVI